MKNRIRAGKSEKDQSLAYYFQNLSSRLKITPKPFIFDNNDIRFSTRFIITGNGDLKTILKAKLN